MHWLRICCLLLLPVLLGTPGEVLAKPGEVLTLRIHPSASSRGPNAALSATVQVELGVGVAKLRMRVEGEGVFAGYEAEAELIGPFDPGANASFELGAYPSGHGAGTLQVEVTGRDGFERFYKRRDLHVLYERGQAWWSDSGLTDLRLRRARSLEENGAPGAVVERARRMVTRGGPGVRDGSTRELQFSGAGGGPVTLTVRGRAHWTDIEGKFHPIPFAKIQILDADLASDEMLAEAVTSRDGEYTVTFTADDGVGQGFPDLFARIFAFSSVADIRPDGDDTTYTHETIPVDEVSSDIVIDLFADNVEDTDTAFSIHSALVAIGAYAGTLASVMPSRIVVRFPTTTSTSQFFRSSRELHVLQLDRFDWDVIAHEYGHYVQNIHGFTNSPGGNHDSGDNLSQTRGSKDVGIRLAWSEGWPTFFGVLGLQRMGVGAEGIPNAGDRSYQDTEDRTAVFDLEFEIGFGEDNENSVASTLWDLVDGNSDGPEDIQISDGVLFNNFAAGNPTTLGQAWESLAANENTEMRARIGSAFAGNRVAPDLNSPRDDIELDGGSVPPVFDWTPNGGGQFNPLDDFSLVVYSSDFQDEIFRHDFLTNPIHVATPAERDQLVAAGVANWIVEGKNTTPPFTSGGAIGSYWSQSRRIGGADIIFVIDESFSMDEELIALKPVFVEALNAIEADLGAAPPPLIQIITFKDDVTIRLTTNSFEETRQELLALTAAGGGPCPESGLQALKRAANNMSFRGGSVIFASDADSNPGPKIEEIIDEIVSKRGAVLSLLSGTCPTIAGGGGSATGSRQPEESAATGETAPTVAARATAPSGDTGAGQKPGGVGGDPADDTPIVDAGQAPMDYHGDTVDTATPLVADGVAVRGIVEGGSMNPDVDYFVLPVEVDVPYRIRTIVHTEDTRFQLIESDGTTVRSFWFGDNNGDAPAGDVHEVALVPTASGDFYLRVDPVLFGDAVYEVALDESPFGEPFASYASIAAATGGQTVFPDLFGSLDTEQIRVSTLNAISSAVLPTVVSANPRLIPRVFFQTPTEGFILTLVLRGRDTSWDGTSVVSFPEGGLSVLETEALDAETLRLVVQADPAAVLGPRNIEVTTGAETAVGRELIEIEGQAFFELLGFEPTLLRQGTTATVRVEAAGLMFGPETVLDLGLGIAIDDLRTVGTSVLEADVSVASNAPVGHRQLLIQDPALAGLTMERATYVYAPEPTGYALAVAALLTTCVLRRRRDPRRPA